jgi:hypothetical protein
MQLRQSRLLPPRQPLRLSDAGDAQSGWIGVLTTEHYNLAMLRIATINEANDRASVFIGALSAGLIALGFRGSATAARPTRSCSRCSSSTRLPSSG